MWIPILSQHHFLKAYSTSIPRWSPIQVLPRPDPASLPRSDEIGCIQGGMAIDSASFLKRLFSPLYCRTQSILLNILILRLKHMALIRSFLWLYAAAAAVYSLNCVWLCDPMHRSLPGSSAHGILQARILEWVAIPSSRGSSQPRNWTCISCVSCIGKQVSLPLAPPGKPISICSVYEPMTFLS